MPVWMPVSIGVVIAFQYRKSVIGVKSFLLDFVNLGVYHVLNP